MPRNPRGKYMDYMQPHGAAPHGAAPHGTAAYSINMASPKEKNR